MTKKEKRKFQELLISLDAEIARARQEEDRERPPYHVEARRAKRAFEKAKKMVTETFPEVYAEVVTDVGI